jgi:hypothetical protein
VAAKTRAAAREQALTQELLTVHAESDETCIVGILARITAKYALICCARCLICLSPPGWRRDRVGFRSLDALLIAACCQAGPVPAGLAVRTMGELCSAAWVAGLVDMPDLSARYHRCGTCLFHSPEEGRTYDMWMSHSTCRPGVLPHV